MGQVLYRKYRSKSLEEVVGQEHITTTLERAIEKDLVSHAYLFTGPHGVGKTSVARILAYKLGGVAYDESKTYTDIIEIDAASNRRIDEIRELRDKINIVPTELAYKIYIVDEVHMLTREAFNALLKTLEEPPAHAIFILATTEMHKVPETIVSRCQRFAFKHIDRPHMLKLLKKVAKAESMSVDDESLELITRHSNGSPRDALSLLDQIGSLADKVTARETRSVLGIASDDMIAGLANLMRGGDMIATINVYRDAISAGNDPVIIASQLSSHLRAGLHKSKSATVDLELLGKLLNISASRHPEAELEILLLSNSEIPTASLNQEPLSVEKPKKEPSREKTSVEAITPTPSKPVEYKKATPEEESEPESPEPVMTGKVLTADEWPEVLSQVKAKKNTLYGIMRMAKADIENGELTLRFAFAFHVKRASDAANKNFLDGIIRGLGLSCSGIEIVQDSSVDTDQPLSEDIPHSQPKTDKPAKPPVPSNVLDVFAGAEMLES